MTDINFDELHATWKQAVDQLIDALKAEEQLVTPEHSMAATEQWDQAAFAIREAEKKAGDARDRYKNALRKKNYGF